MPAKTHTLPDGSRITLAYGRANHNPTLWEKMETYNSMMPGHPIYLTGAQKKLVRRMHPASHIHKLIQEVPE